jgi:hypothetical protein
MDSISARLVLQKGETIKQHLLNIPAGWTDNRWQYVGETFNKIHEYILALESRIKQLETPHMADTERQALVDLVKAQQAEIARLKEDIACFEAMKEGVQTRIADLERDIAALQRDRVATLGSMLP